MDFSSISGWALLTGLLCLSRFACNTQRALFGPKFRLVNKQLWLVAIRNQ